MQELYGSTHSDNLLEIINTKTIGFIPHTTLDQRFCELFFLLQKCLKIHVIILQLQNLGYISLNLSLFYRCKNCVIIHRICHYFIVIEIGLQFTQFEFHGY
jgi:hypothetical protein